MRGILYSTSDDRLKLNKTLNNLGNIEFTMKESCDILNPVLTLKNNDSILKSNYFFIEKLNRFYFIKDISFFTNNTVQVELEIDVLMSYRDAINSLSAFIERQEYLYHPFYVDNELPIRQDRFIEVEVQAYFPVSKNGSNFVLTTF